MTAWRRFAAVAICLRRSFATEDTSMRPNVVRDVWWMVFLVSVVYLPALLTLMVIDKLAA